MGVANDGVVVSAWLRRCHRLLHVNVGQGCRGGDPNGQEVATQSLALPSTAQPQYNACIGQVDPNATAGQTQEVTQGIRMHSTRHSPQPEPRVMIPFVDILMATKVQ